MTRAHLEKMEETFSPGVPTPKVLERWLHLHYRVMCLQNCSLLVLKLGLVDVGETWGEQKTAPSLPVLQISSRNRRFRGNLWMDRNNKVADCGTRVRRLNYAVAERTCCLQVGLQFAGLWCWSICANRTLSLLIDWPRYDTSIHVSVFASSCRPEFVVDLQFQNDVREDLKIYNRMHIANFSTSSSRFWNCFKARRVQLKCNLLHPRFAERNFDCIIIELTITNLQMEKCCSVCYHIRRIWNCLLSIGWLSGRTYVAVTFWSVYAGATLWLENWPPVYVTYNIDRCFCFRLPT